MRRIAQPQRNGTDRPNVRRDVLAADSVAARGAAHEHAVLVGKRDAHAVDLQLGNVVDGVCAAHVDAKPAPHAVVEGSQLLFGIRVVEAEHRLDVLDGRESGGHTSADAAGGRIVR